MKYLLIPCLPFLLLLSSCLSIQPLAVKSVMCCDVPKAVKTEAEVALMIELYNPNDFAISLKSYCLDVRLNGNTLGTARSDDPDQIGPEKVLKRSVTVRTSSEKLMQGGLMLGLSTLLGNGLPEMELEVAGSVVGSAKGFSKRVRIREKYPVKLNF